MVALLWCQYTYLMNNSSLKALKCWNHMNMSSDICAAWNRLDCLSCFQRADMSPLFIYIPITLLPTSWSYSFSWMSWKIWRICRICSCQRSCNSNTQMLDRIVEDRVHKDHDQFIESIKGDDIYRLASLYYNNDSYAFFKPPTWGSCNIYSFVRFCSQRTDKVSDSNG